MRGKTISIYIPDGDARSLKICDLKNSIVKSIFVPRNKLKDANNISELQDPGIYFLFGEDEISGKIKVYIVEADPILKRFKQHNKSKEFWTKAICFMSEKKNLNKAHIKFLENYCCNKLTNSSKCILSNSTNPTRSTITASDKDFVLSFFDDLKILISALGFPIFDQVKEVSKNILICKGKDAVAKGVYSPDGLTVLKGSKCNLTESPTAGAWVINMRQKLKDSNVLKKSGKVYEFIEDYMFNSPSAAAVTVLARRANGWTEWKDSKGNTLDKRVRQT